MTEKLINHLGRLITPIKISPELKDKIVEKAQILKFSSGTFILKKGQICRGAYFLANGIARSYYRIGEKEITSRLMEEGFIITSWVSYYKQEPGDEFIIALEDCTTIYLAKTDLEELYKEYPAFNDISRKQLELSFYNAELRTQVLRSQTAIEKYKHFYETQSSLLQRVPLKHIASYLGMTEETLSRVRSKFHKKN